MQWKCTVSSLWDDMVWGTTSISRPVQDRHWNALRQLWSLDRAVARGMSELTNRWQEVAAISGANSQSIVHTRNLLSTSVTWGDKDPQDQVGVGLDTKRRWRSGVAARGDFEGSWGSGGDGYGYGGARAVRDRSVLSANVLENEAGTDAWGLLWFMTSVYQNGLNRIVMAVDAVSSARFGTWGNSNCALRRNNGTRCCRGLKRKGVKERLREGRGLSKFCSSWTRQSFGHQQK